MGTGALSWCAAAGLWLAGCGVPRFAPAMAGFLVLTIVGERLELTRVMQRPPLAARLLLGAIALFAVGLGMAVADAPGAVRVAGAGLLAQAAWLARYDVARRTVRMGAVTRFMALALLGGYVWLAVAGVLWLAHGLDLASTSYDASLHAVFLGFVMSMVFAHAPVIVPAVLRVRLPFARRFYAHLVLLHASLALRLLGGDLAGGLHAWQWGGILGEVAILLFLATSAHAVVLGVSDPSRRPRPS
jgi:hypothetical protein